MLIQYEFFWFGCVAVPGSEEHVFWLIFFTKLPANLVPKCVGIIPLRLEFILAGILDESCTNSNVWLCGQINIVSEMFSQFLLLHINNPIVFSFLFQKKYGARFVGKLCIGTRHGACFVNQPAGVGWVMNQHSQSWLTLPLSLSICLPLPLTSVFTSLLPPSVCLFALSVAHTLLY